MISKALKREKRNIGRKPFSYPVDFEITDLGSDNLRHLTLEGNAVDISSSGLGLLTTTPLNRGEVVKVYIPITSLNTVLPSFSEVCWVQNTDSHYRVGLRFLV